MCGVCTPDKSFKMSKRLVRPIERQRMRPWLEGLLNRGSVDGLKWIDGGEKIFEIPWRHGSRHGWNQTKDADLFERWAKHTGKFNMIFIRCLHHRHSNSGPPFFLIWFLPRLWYGSLSGSISLSHSSIFYISCYKTAAGPRNKS